MKAPSLPSRGFTLVEKTLLVGLLVAVALAIFSAAVIQKNRKAADHTKALGNLHRIGISLTGFEEEYGSFPDDLTAATIRKRHLTSSHLIGPFSNGYFRQLIAAGHMPSEAPFFCKTPYTRPPDNQMTSDHLLENGEVGFGYIMRTSTRGFDRTGRPDTPLVVGPLLNAETNWTFDSGPFGRKAVVLRIDRSVRAETIGLDDSIRIENGPKIQHIGESTVWGPGVNPILHAPQKLHP